MFDIRERGETETVERENSILGTWEIGLQPGSTYKWPMP